MGMEEFDGIYEKKAKLVGLKGGDKLCLINFCDDWIHDHYKESYIYYGRMYSPFESFHPNAVHISGYFRDDDSNAWIKVENGIARLAKEKYDGWWDSLEALLKQELNP